MTVNILEVLLQKKQHAQEQANAHAAGFHRFDAMLQTLSDTIEMIQAANPDGVLKESMLEAARAVEGIGVSAGEAIVAVSEAL